MNQKSITAYNMTDNVTRLKIIYKQSQMSH